MARLYVIDRIKVDEAQSASSVVGKVSGGGFGNSGASWVQGRVDTLHDTSLFAGGRVYTLREVNQKIAVRTGDDLLVVCHQASNGSWKVVSAANLSNNTFHCLDPQAASLYFWVLAFFSLITIIFLIGFILAPILFWQAIRFTTVNIPQLNEANRLLVDLRSVTDVSTIDQAIASFNTSGTTAVPGSTRETAPNGQIKGQWWEEFAGSRSER